jgi:hypothetical protein
MQLQLELSHVQPTANRCERCQPGGDMGETDWQEGRQHGTDRMRCYSPVQLDKCFSMGAKPRGCC